MTERSHEDAMLLATVVDRIIPADRDPGALAAGTLEFVTDHLRRDPGSAKEVQAGLRALTESAVVLFGRSFGELPATDQDRVLAEHQLDVWFSTLVELTGEGFYADPGNGGNTDAVSWKMVGYDPHLPPRATAPAPKAIPSEIAGDYDAIVVGAVRAAALLLACSQKPATAFCSWSGTDHELDDPLARDHLRNQRLSAYGHNAGPEIDGHPRVVVDPEGRESVLRPHEAGYQNNAAAVGGGTLVYGAQAWRFHPDDFRMASRYGVPTGSSLADWPIKYGDLEPYYGCAEWEIGTAGEPGHAGARTCEFPMPPLPGYAARRILAHGAERLGLPTFAPPLLVNSVARDGRGACDECGSCVGFRCPSGAKNGTQNTVIPRALKTGRCTLVASATVTAVDTDGTGTVCGVTFVHHPGGQIRHESVRARAVVLCGGAIETARLLLLSRSDRHPNGLGNANDLVGRSLQGHFAAFVYGLFEQQTYDRRGPGVKTALAAITTGIPASSAVR